VVHGGTRRAWARGKEDEEKEMGGVGRGGEEFIGFGSERNRHTVSGHRAPAGAPRGQLGDGERVLGAGEAIAAGPAPDSGQLAAGGGAGRPRTARRGGARLPGRRYSYRTGAAGKYRGGKRSAGRRGKFAWGRREAVIFSACGGGLAQVGRLAVPVRVTCASAAADGGRLPNERGRNGHDPMARPVLFLNHQIIKLTHSFNHKTFRDYKILDTITDISRENNTLTRHNWQVSHLISTLT
jgi:hypothetical protein